MEWLMSYIRNICVFTLIITLILNVFPDSNYRKYIKLFAGFLLLVLVLQPFFKRKNFNFDPENYIGDISYLPNDKIAEQESKLEEKISERIEKNNKQERNGGKYENSEN